MILTHFVSFFNKILNFLIDFAIITMKRGLYTSERNSEMYNPLNDMDYSTIILLFFQQLVLFSIHPKLIKKGG